MRKTSNRGNAFVEYLMLALIVAFGAIWLFNGGNFQGTRATVDASFNNMINEIVTP